METSAQPALQECDIIMKGGITSGVVYPTAVCELAKRYRFRSIGGTSAGAIAAVLTAAAELGRTAPQGGFQHLERLPTFLRDKLVTLFQPSLATRPAFRSLLAFLGGKRFKAARALGTGVASQPLGFLLGAVAGFAVFAVLVLAASRGLALNAWGWVVSGLFALLGGIAGAAITFVRGTLRGLQGNFFGMCNGLDRDPGGADLPLTPWMAGAIQAAAGRAASEPPLTFGHLWQAGGSASLEELERDPGRRAINLEVMTTNVTNGMPMRLPFVSREYFFDPDEIGRFFPPDIVEWMVSHPPKLEREADQALIDRVTVQTPYRPLPAPADLPVVVAARMSLSFPVLLSAVPLHRIDWSRKANQEAKEAGRAPALERCWFSDGGIGSNFPVHFFDGLLPGRPTFGINLRPFHPDFPRDEDESQNVRFPQRAGQEIAPTYTAIPNLFAFLGAIFGTMQNWVDNSQMRLPGYRDRVAHVNLTAEEGGLNLVMPKDVIAALVQRGEVAGQLLRDEFDWDRHRWIRYRTAMQQLQKRLAGMGKVYDGGFSRFLDDYDSAAKGHSYAKSTQWKKGGMEKTGELLTAVEGWEGEYFQDGAPGPEPELRIGPKR